MGISLRQASPGRAKTYSNVVAKLQVLYWYNSICPELVHSEKATTRRTEIVSLMRCANRAG